MRGDFRIEAEGKPMGKRGKGRMQGVEEERPGFEKGSDRAEGIEPMLLSLDDVSTALRISRRTAERMRSAGKLPAPDLRLGKLPRWRPSTIEDWISSQAGRR